MILMFTSTAEIMIRYNKIRYRRRV